MLATDFSPLRFSTGKLSERERLPIWCEEFGRALLRVDIEPLALPFYVEAELRALPDVRIIKSVSSAMHFQRTRALVSLMLMTRSPSLSAKTVPRHSAAGL
jgi:hypothetical protein